MKKLTYALSKLEKKHYGAVAILQTLIIGIFLYLFLFQPGAKLSNQHVAGQETKDYSKIIDQDVLICFQLPQSEKALCAEITGRKIASYFSSPQDRLRQCLKFRPAHVHYCQLGLTE